MSGEVTAAAQMSADEFYAATTDTAVSAAAPAALSQFPAVPFVPAPLAAGPETGTQPVALAEETEIETQPAAEPRIETQPVALAAEPEIEIQPVVLAAEPEIDTHPVTTAGEYVRDIPAAPQVPVAQPAAMKVQLDWSSGLTQIETDPNKLKGAEIRSEQEQPASRVKRVRPPLPPASNEPLTQVETGRS